MAPKTIKIDEVEYIRADSITDKKSFEGMDYCIVRSRDQGVMCGYVESINGRQVTLHQARQLWKWNSSFVLPDLAEFGLKDESAARLSTAMSQPMIMLEACGVLTCTTIAANQLINVKAQNNDN